METDQERVRRMLNEGKINFRQAQLLLQAFDESCNRTQKLFQEVEVQRKRREQEIWKVLGGWFLIVVVLAGAFIYLGGRGVVVPDTQKALAYFNQASSFLANGNYHAAVESCKKGIEQAPRSPLGYSLLGASYKLLYTQTHDTSVREKAEAAFKKADRLKEDLKRRRKMNITGNFFTFVLLILITGAITIILLFIYNALIKKEENLNQARAQMEAQYQRRLDLVPALLEAVKDYAAHENQTHRDIAEARTRIQEALNHREGTVLSKEKLKEIPHSHVPLGAALSKLFALVERYPDLKANQNFLAVQKQIEETENRIAAARESYNRSVKSYNALLRGFPGNLVAALFKFEPKGYFESEGGVS